MAASYQVSYPTIRLRLDRLLARVRALDAAPPADAFDAKVRLLVTEGQISISLGKELLRIHRRVVKGGKE